MNSKKYFGVCAQSGLCDCKKTMWLGPSQIAFLPMNAFKTTETVEIESKHETFATIDDCTFNTVH